MNELYRSYKLDNYSNVKFNDNDNNDDNNNYHDHDNKPYDD